jgi:hypothetical protein
MKTTTKNMQSKPINQSRGPTVGNGDNGSKRKEFITEKTGPFRTELADTIMNALAGRGEGMKPKIIPAVEGLNTDTGPKANPTAGGTKYNVKTKAPGKITK